MVVQCTYNPEGPKFAGNCSISSGFRDEQHLTFLAKFKMAAEIRKSIGWVGILLGAMISKFLPLLCLAIAYPRLTLKEGPEVKSEHTRRCLVHGFTLQTSRKKKK